MGVIERKKRRGRERESEIKKGKDCTMIRQRRYQTMEQTILEMKPPNRGKEGEGRERE